MSPGLPEVEPRWSTETEGVRSPDDGECRLDNAIRVRGSSFTLLARAEGLRIQSKMHGRMIVWSQVLRKSIREWELRKRIG